LGVLLSQTTKFYTFLKECLSSLNVFIHGGKELFEKSAYVSWNRIRYMTEATASVSE
jgi:hypothetical protein